MLGMLLVFALAAPLPVAEYGDSLLFIAGFNAYLREEYDVAVENLNRVIKEYPGSPFRDMSLFCLARASYLTGDH
jgi:outer membrane protein assembly factor BamD (BamD/ComL family)